MRHKVGPPPDREDAEQQSPAPKYWRGGISYAVYAVLIFALSPRMQRESP
jgi:hypothetical protein